MIDAPRQFTFDAIGVVRSPFKEKFGIPRQPGLTTVPAVIELYSPYAVADAVKGLEAFSHIWISFVFHAVMERAWKPQVRPPRLGGNEKLGVFATRSTHRPNPIGLSVVALERIDNSAGVRLHIRGADLLDGTPIIDIKPYLPYADSIAEASAGFAQALPQVMPVHWQIEALNTVEKLPPGLRVLIEDVLRYDPRPAYQDQPQRIYGMRIADWNVRFRVDADAIEIVAVDEWIT